MTTAQEEEYQHIIKEFNERQYYCSRGMGAAGKKSSRQAQYQSPPFSLRHCNIQDPVDLNNNLGFFDIMYSCIGVVVLMLLFVFYSRYSHISPSITADYNGVE